MKREYKVIFAAQDVGGFNALAPVIRKLEKDKRFGLVTILAEQSWLFAAKQGIKYIDANQMSLVELRKIVKKERPDLVFTGTSLNDSIEKKITDISQKEKIPIVAIIDFWSNYKLRFSGKRTANLKYLPDYILVVDKTMKREMIKNGFRSQNIFVVGNPFFDTISTLKNYKRENLITFFSQPYSEVVEKEDNVYDEVMILKDLVEVLEKLQPKALIKIQFHPKAKKTDKFNEIIKNSKLDMEINNNSSTEDLIKRSKLVIGINSMVLFQAAIMGKKVLSYQPNSEKRDCLPSNRLGLSQGVYKKEELFSVIKNLLLSPKKINSKLIKKYTQNNSTQKAVNFIIKVIKYER